MTYAARTSPVPRGAGFTPYLMDTLGSAGTLNAPLGGNSIVILNAPPQGYYEIQVIAGFGSSGVVTSLDAANMALNAIDMTTQANTTITTLAPPTAPGGGNPIRMYLSLSGTDSLTITAKKAASPNSVYVAALYATALHPGA